MTKPSLNHPLTQLEELSRHSAGKPGAIVALLARLARTRFHDPAWLLRFHESLLFLRAFPAAPELVSLTEELLDGFYERVELLRREGVKMSAFDEFETAGVAGTTMQDTLNFDVVRWLARRYPRQVEIAWDDYEDDRAMGSTWPRFIPLLEEDANVEAHIPWRLWLDTARGKTTAKPHNGNESDLQWLIRRFESLPISDRERAELYDSLRLPVRWRLDNLRLSRTRNWNRPRKSFYHDAPLISRSRVSLPYELTRPAPTFTKLSRRAGEAVLDNVREVMAVRYRELYGTTLGDPNSVVRADLGTNDAGRGVVIHLWNLLPSRRMPLRAYVAGYTLKNGVPVNYMEAMGLCDWLEVGFNTFYTYRQGETAWIYAQALRCLRAFTSAATFSVHPYQIGQHSDEAIESGAFWFYRKLGFRSGSADLEALARKEERKISVDAAYRTPPATLRRLADAPVFFESSKSNRESDQDKNAAISTSSGAWDTFSIRGIGLSVNRRMAEEFGGDSERSRKASVKQVAHALSAKPYRWNAEERKAFETWSLVLALVPGLENWKKKEKAGMVAIIRAQAGPGEMCYLHLMQRHPRLREALLELNASPERWRPRQLRLTIGNHAHD